MLKILLAVDGSEQSAAAIDEIARRGLLAGSEVRIISVVEPPAYFPQMFSGEGVNVSLYADVERTARERASAALEIAEAKLRTDECRRQLSVTTKVMFGSPKQVILEEADAFGADLILVGSHGHGMLEGFLLGSVSQAVALHATCSVEIVRSPKSKKSGGPAVMQEHAVKSAEATATERWENEGGHTKADRPESRCAGRLGAKGRASNEAS